MQKKSPTTASRRPKKRKMTPRDAIRMLADAGISDAKSDVFALYEAASGRSRAALMFSLDEDILSAPFYGRFSEMLQRRLSREPLQYILGKWSFFGDEYFVSPDCLIPRADTETLVEVLLDELKTGKMIADICCGSGCIGIAALRNSGASCVSVDISEKALAIAQKNAESLGVSDRIRFGHCDVLNKSAVDEFFSASEFDIIASNPPYIKLSDADKLAPELAYEPSIALFGGDNGMIFYESITANFLPYLKKDGSFIFEIGFDEENDIRKIAAANGLSCKIVTDIEKRPRVAAMKRL